MGSRQVVMKMLVEALSSIGGNIYGFVFIKMIG